MTAVECHMYCKFRNHKERTCTKDKIIIDLDCATFQEELVNCPVDCQRKNVCFKGQPLPTDKSRCYRPPSDAIDIPEHHCPDCKTLMYVDADGVKCPKCGYGKGIVL